MILIQLDLIPLIISSLTIFLGNTDEAEEGVWADLYNKSKLVNYLPWGPNRPYSGEGPEGDI